MWASNLFEHAKKSSRNVTLQMMNSAQPAYIGLCVPREAPRGEGTQVFLALRPNTAHLWDMEAQVWRLENDCLWQHVSSLSSKILIYSRVVFPRRWFVWDSLFLFPQDEVNQIMETNLWLRHVSSCIIHEHGKVIDSFR